MATFRRRSSIFAWLLAIMLVSPSIVMLDGDDGCAEGSQIESSPVARSAKTGHKAPVETPQRSKSNFDALDEEDDLELAGKLALFVHFAEGSTVAGFLTIRGAVVTIRPLPWASLTMPIHLRC